jgi:aspartyl-tRNA(Asn)/glutamyl-tRNA(Gln) amidotransferase subunit A
LVLAAISGHDPQDAASLRDAAFSYSASAPLKPLRIGWLTNAWKKVTPTIEAATRDALDILRKHGAIIKDAKLPEGPWESAAGTIISVEGAAAFESLIESGRVAELNDPLGKVAAYVNQQIPASDYVRAVRIRAILQRKIDEMFDHFDVIAAASLPVTASPLTANLETDLDFPDPLGGIGNVCGLPAMSVPCGFDSKKLPIGLQFVGRALDEHKVVGAARLFQQHTDWHRKRPALT